MPNTNDFSNNKIHLSVLCRVESGCLGPDGKFFIEDFCAYANEAFNGVLEEQIDWFFVPRHDKSLPEIQYQYTGRNLSRDMAKQLFSFRTIDIDELKESLNEKLSDLIDQFLAR